MPKTYAGEDSELVMTPLTDQTLLSIGKIIRLFAEIQDIVTLHITLLAEVSESRALVLLGKSGISARIKMAEYLADLHSTEARQAHDSVFTPAFFDALECRNTLAHGAYLGITKDGDYAFMVDKLYEAEQLGSGP